jgi:hypothetical protein
MPNQRDMLCKRKDFLFNPDKTIKKQPDKMSAREQRRYAEKKSKVK